jgi:hypothetical protein
MLEWGVCSSEIFVVILSRSTFLKYFMKNLFKSANHSTNSCTVMESGNHSKNGASLKSHMIRNNFFNIVGAAIVLLFFTSCSTVFYQVYKVQPIDEVSKSTNFLVYEDENCKVFYDFWGQGGNVGILFYNKTNNNLYVNLKESFFINNGIAYDYYKNREFTNSENSSVSISNSSTEMYNYTALNTIGLAASKSISGDNYQGYKQTNSFAAGIASSVAATAGIAASKTKEITTLSGSSVKYIEKDIICIPSKTSKIISEYSVTNTLYRDCNLLKYPSGKKQIQTKVFSENKSPFIFGNRIAYYIGNSEKLNVFENKFYVSEITNYPQKEIMIKTYDEFCGEKGLKKEFYFKNSSPDKFYIQYTNKNKGIMKH